MASQSWTVRPDDPRYEDLVRRGVNQRFRGRPEYVRLVGSTEDVVQAVQEAVRAGRRLVARSGGHCLEGFVGDPAVQVVIDTSLMTAVYEDRGGWAVEAGATLGEAYRKLFYGWGVNLPAGVSPAVGVGGHILGGAFGFGCRKYGLAADYLHAVEVVVVDADGTARAVVATREPSDPNHDLWWAHTGGGGGNFGIVTRYWFRSLPAAPSSAHVLRASWTLADVGQAGFGRLIRNFGEWCAEHVDSLPDVYSQLFLVRGAPTVDLKTLSIGGAGLLDDHLAAIGAGVGPPCSSATAGSSWISFALDPFPELFRSGGGDVPFKIKDAFFRKPLDPRQIEVAWGYLTGAEHGAVGGMFGMTTYGGQVNRVDPAATATAHRDAVMTSACNTGWGRPEDEAPSLAWVRGFYRDLFAETGGAPVHGGTMINHPDADLADPAWNTSGVPWHELYYRDNYRRLQQVKARWDPGDVFRHALSIRP